MTITSAHLKRCSGPPSIASRLTWRSGTCSGEVYLFFHYHRQCEANATAQIQAAESPENLGRFRLSIMGLVDPP